MKRFYQKVVSVCERLRTQWFNRQRSGLEAVLPSVAVAPSPTPEGEAETGILPLTKPVNGLKTAASPVQTLMKQLEAYLKAEYEFRFNSINETNEYRRKGSMESFRRLGEREENTICIEAHQQGIPLWERL